MNQVINAFDFCLFTNTLRTDEIISILKQNMAGEITLQRRANNEHLMVLRFSHKQHNPWQLGQAQTGNNNKGNSTDATPTL